MRFIKVWIGLGVLVTVVIVIFGVAVSMYRVPSESMVPALKVGDRIVVLRLGYSPKVGDVVVFHPPAGAFQAQCPERTARGSMCVAPASRLEDVKFVKRIVAGPGDKISMVDGRLIRNGKPESGYKIKECLAGSGCSFPTTVVVPPGQWFMLGDNRGSSDDSRFWGTVPKSAIIGRELFKAY